MSFTKVVLTGVKDKVGTAFGRFNTLIDDLLATTTGKGASQIGIEDDAGNVDAANVEDAITEIYSDFEGTRTLADTLAEDSSTTTGLTWGYQAGTIRVDNSIVSITAGTVSLTDDATNYIEVDVAGSVSRNTTGFTANRIPIRQVTTVAGAQTVSTDKRSWFPAQPADMVIATTITIPNTGLHLLDSNASHDLIIKPGSNLTADRILTVTTGDAARAVTLSGNLSIAGDLTATAAGIAMIGDGGATKAYFYQNTAPTGWTIDGTPADALLAVKGGADAYNATGGTQAGTWTQPNHAHNHTHTGPSHTHTGPSHTHTTGNVTLTAAQSGMPDHSHLSPHNTAGGTTFNGLVAGITTLDAYGTTTGSSGAVGASSAHNHGATGAEGTGATGTDGTGATGADATNGATATTYRPLAQVGIICTLTAI